MVEMTQSQLGQVTVLRPVGGLTLDGIEAIRPQFEQATSGHAKVVVDLSGVTLMTTPGLSMLLAGARRVAQDGGRMAITGAKGVVADLLHVCKLDEVFPVVPDLETAVQHVESEN
jgi:anti-sigma B factor antagonist